LTLILSIQLKMKCDICNKDNGEIYAAKTWRTYCKECFRKKNEVKEEIKEEPKEEYTEKNIADLFPWLK